MNLKNLMCRWPEILYLRSTEEAAERLVRGAETRKGKASLKQVWRLRGQRDIAAGKLLLPRSVGSQPQTGLPHSEWETGRRTREALGKENRGFCLPGRLGPHLLREALLLLAAPAREVWFRLQLLHSHVWVQWRSLWAAPSSNFRDPLFSGKTLGRALVSD